ncbi:MAG: hypothetical protein WC497_01935 [Patescibacteria group bacterium]
MSLKRFLIFMTIVTLICWLGWITVVFYIDPFSTGFIGLLLFYVSLFFALIGTFSLLGFFFRVWFLKTEMVFKHVGIAFRQALLFALLVIGAFVLQGMRIFTWWNAALFIISLSLIELFFLTRKSYS